MPTSCPDLSVPTALDGDPQVIGGEMGKLLSELDVAVAVELRDFVKRSTLFITRWLANVCLSKVQRILA